MDDKLATASEDRSASADKPKDGIEKRPDIFDMIKAYRSVMKSFFPETRKKVEEDIGEILKKDFDNLHNMKGIQTQHFIDDLDGLDIINSGDENFNGIQEIILEAIEKILFTNNRYSRYSPDDESLKKLIGIWGKLRANLRKVWNKNKCTKNKFTIRDPEDSEMHEIEKWFDEELYNYIDDNECYLSENCIADFFRHVILILGNKLGVPPQKLITFIQSNLESGNVFPAYNEMDREDSDPDKQTNKTPPFSIDVRDLDIKNYKITLMGEPIFTIVTDYEGYGANLTKNLDLALVKKALNSLLDKLKTL